jgi:nucleotide-binding universal stress UspA family protein
MKGGELVSDLTKMIAIPLDGSKEAMKSIDYVSFLFGPKHNLEVTLLYILPSLPSIIVDDRHLSHQDRLRVKSIEDKNVHMAERILADGKKTLIQRGFRDEQIRTVYQAKKLGIPRDICMWADDRQADGVIISTRGRSRIEVFFMGEVARKLLEYCNICPVWIVSGVVKSKQVLIALDSSENALRAVDHAGFMLSGTECQVTLFHSMRDLRRFMPKEVLKEAPELEELWKQKAGEQIAPYMKKAKDMLIQGGLSESQVNTKVVDGSRSAAKDIVEEAESSKSATILLGRRGQSGVKEFSMGSVATKVLEGARSMTVCVVQ